MRTEGETGLHEKYACLIALKSLSQLVTKTIVMRKQKDEPLFRPNDMMLVYDGRSPSNFDSISKAITNTLSQKEVTDTMPRRRYTVVRRAFTNTEFMKDGYLAPRRKSSLNPKTPDPLENLVLILPKTFEFEYRESPNPSIVVDNFSRGWGSLSMKMDSEQEQLVYTLQVLRSDMSLQF